MRRLFNSLSFFLLALVASGWICVGANALSSPLKIFSFQAGGFYGFDGDKFTSGQIAWTPILELGLIGIRGEVGATHLKNAAKQGFFMTNYEALLRFSLVPALVFEVGGGAQTWHSNGGTAKVLSVGLSIPLLGPIDRVYGGYSRLFMGDGLNELKVGLGFSL